MLLEQFSSSAICTVLLRLLLDSSLAVLAPGLVTLQGINCKGDPCVSSNRKLLQGFFMGAQATSGVGNVAVKGRCVCGSIPWLRSFLLTWVFQ